LIAEFLQTQRDIAARAAFIGKLVVEWKHFACEGARIPVIQPFVAQMHPSFVAIVVAYNESGPVIVHIPAELFEGGTHGEIRTWVTRQNVARLKVIEEAAAEQARQKRESELAVLEELKEKYQQ